MSRSPIDDSDLDDLSDVKPTRRVPTPGAGGKSPVTSPVPSSLSPLPPSQRPVGPPQTQDRTGTGGPAVNQKVQSVTPAEPPVLKGWEHLIGRTFIDRMGPNLGRRGLIRRVAAGVTYTVPPKVLSHRWKANLDEAQQYEMELSADFINQAEDLRSLQSLANELRTNPPNGRGDPRLRELDIVVATLLSTAEQLHADEFGLGLISPRNVLWRKNSPEDVLLPDVGFHRTQDSFALEIPAWLTDKHEFAPLWQKSDANPVGPLELQACSGGTEFHQKNDIRTLARLFATILLGTPQESASHIALRSDASVWHALANAEQGAYSSISEFRYALATAPLSIHFTPVQHEIHSSEGSTSEPISFGKLMVGSLVTCALLVAGLWYSQKTPPTVKPPIPDWLSPYRAEFEDLKKSDDALIGSFNYSQGLISLKQKITQETASIVDAASQPAVDELLNDIEKVLKDFGRN